MVKLNQKKILNINKKKLYNIKLYNCNINFEKLCK